MIGVEKRIAGGMGKDGERNRGLRGRRTGIESRIEAARCAAHQAGGVGRITGIESRVPRTKGGEKNRGLRRRVMLSQKDVPFLEKGTKNSALASGCGFAGWKAAAGSHPHAARRSGKGRFVSGSWMAARSFGTSAKGRRRYRQRQTLSPTGLSTGRLCADNLVGGEGFAV